VYVVVEAGFTVACPWGNVHGLHTAGPAPSAMESERAVPPVIFHDNVAEAPEVMLLGEAVRLNVKGIVTVTDLGAVVPPGPVAVRE
jgi:hypothetical protein